MTTKSEELEVLERFINDLFHSELITADQRDWMLARAEHWNPPPARPAPAMRSSVPPSSAAPPPPTLPVRPPPPPPPSTALPPPPFPTISGVASPTLSGVSEPPSPTGGSTASADHNAADLAIRLLTILGMLLLFTGITGFVVFAFGDVGKGWRPLAELLIPLTLFASAPLFRRVDAPFVARAVIAVGGIALPIMAAASLVDNAAPPTDPTGRAIGTMLFLVGSLITTGYGIVALRRPNSLLRFLVFPMLWLTVAAAALIMEISAPSGAKVFVPLPGQWAAVSCVIAICGLAFRRSDEHLLTQVGRTALLPAALSSFVIVWLTTVSDHWAATPLIVAGLASIVTIESLSPRLRSGLISGLQIAFTVLTAIVCFHDHGVAPTGVVVILMVIGAIEWQDARRPSVTAATLLAITGAVMLPLTLDRSSIALFVATVLFVWSCVRHFRPTSSIPSGIVNVTVWVSTITVSIALRELWSAPDSLMFMAAVAAVVAVGLRLTDAPRLRDDLLVGSWVLVVALATLALPAFQLLNEMDAYPPRLGLATAVVATTALATAARWPTLRFWSSVSGAFIALCWLIAWTEVDWVIGFAPIAWIGTLLVISSQLRRNVLSGQLGLAGLATTASAILGSLSTASIGGETWPWAATAALLAAPAGWFIVESRGRVADSPVQELLQGGIEPNLAQKIGTESEPPWSLTVRFLQFMVINTMIITAISAVASAGLSTAPVIWGAALASLVPLGAIAFGRRCIRNYDQAGNGYIELGWAIGIAIALITALVPFLTLDHDVPRWPPPLATAVLIVDAIALGPALRWRRFIAWGAAVILWFQVTYAVKIEWGDPPMTLALLVMSLLAIITARCATGTVRPLLQTLGAIAAAAAWSSFLGWAALDTTKTVIVHSAISVAAVMALAPAMRWNRIRFDWPATWSWLPALWTLAAVNSAFLSDASVRIGHLAAAFALAAWAVAIAMIARPLQQSFLRILCTFVAAGACWLGVSGFDPTPSQAIACASTTALALLAVAIGLHLGKRPTWVSPMISGALLASGSAIAVGALPNCPRPAFIASLLVTATVLTGIGAVRRKIAWNVGAVAPALVAWLVFAEDALRGEQQWIVLPVGIALLICVELVRFDRRRAGLDGHSQSLTILDIAAMTFIISSSIIGVIGGSTTDGLIAISIGIALGVLGFVTRVRRRLIFGAATVLSSAILLILPPLVGLVPTDARWLPWSLLIIAGMGAVIAAALVERGRRAVRTAGRRFIEMTDDWE